MSDAPASKTISLTEINGRIDELQAQRDGALARCAKIAGEKAEAIELARLLRAEVDRLTEQLKTVNEINERVTRLEQHDAQPKPDHGAETAH